MRPSTIREPLKLSKIPAHRINLRDGERRSVVCPDCQEWHAIRRHMIWPHRLDGARSPKCPGSARRVVLDLDLDTWHRKALEADASAAGRRAARTIRKPRPQPVPALHQMHPATRRLRAALEEHSRQDCIRCRAGHCDTATDLLTRIRRLAQAQPPAPLYAKLRTALLEHRATCTTCTGGKPCTPARRLADRVAALVQDQMRRTRPDLYR